MFFPELETRVTGFIELMSNEVKLIGIAGGSGSGKSTLAKAILDSLGETQCCVLQQDAYFIDQSHRFDGDGGAVNYDHPSSIDFELLSRHLSELKKGHLIEVPIYDFVTHARLPETRSFQPKKIVVVEGTLIFHSESLREDFDEMIFIQTPEDVRYRRRLKRDIEERGRSPDGIKRQFDLQVKPMHDAFVEPCSEYAKVCLKDPGSVSEWLSEIQPIIKD